MAQCAVAEARAALRVLHMLQCANAAASAATRPTAVVKLLGHAHLVLQQHMRTRSDRESELYGQTLLQLELAEAEAVEHLRAGQLHGCVAALLEAQRHFAALAIGVASACARDLGNDTLV